MSEVWQVFTEVPGKCPMCGHEVSAHTGAEDEGCTERIGYSHINGDEDCGCPLVPQAEAVLAAFRDAEHVARRAADVWDEDGGDPCRVRVLRDFADTLAAWADGTGSPDGPASMYRALLTEKHAAALDPTHTEGDVPDE